MIGTRPTIHYHKGYRLAVRSFGGLECNVDVYQGKSRLSLRTFKSVEEATRWIDQHVAAREKWFAEHVMVAGAHNIDPIATALKGKFSGAKK